MASKENAMDIDLYENKQATGMPLRGCLKELQNLKDKVEGKTRSPKKKKHPSKSTFDFSDLGSALPRAPRSILKRQQDIMDDIAWLKFYEETLRS
ncbi:hypothetical protein AVEN_112883-1 [Araneus ventricosus]|uniref:Uncharacterized protein n=1 Tax=Araneus ventricosus TaxID=182803 RepID=A0A4Y2SYI0_ARAVE|nr:hypothetical protein AVEN_112883-1 [Araneus ventricosus]